MILSFLCLFVVFQIFFALGTLYGAGLAPLGLGAAHAAVGALQLQLVYKSAQAEYNGSCNKKGIVGKQSAYTAAAGKKGAYYALSGRISGHGTDNSLYLAHGVTSGSVIISFAAV